MLMRKGQQMIEFDLRTHPDPVGLSLSNCFGMSSDPKTDRKLRLFACACCRRALDLLPPNIAQVAAEIAEKYADGQPIASEVEFIRNRIPLLANEESDLLDYAALDFIAFEAAHRVGTAFYFRSGKSFTEVEQQGALIRDLAKPNYRSDFSPEWRADTAVSLARLMYDTYEFSAMPILADALQDAGCDNADILDHCRGPGPHVRGCWVVDLVLAKE